MTTEHFLVAISFLIIAMLYASVGFGGGTSYLAVLALLSIDMQVMRPTALLCNIVVVISGTYIFYKEGKFEFIKFWPFIVASIPLAFLGGQFPIKEQSFFVILGITLASAALLLWFQESIQRLASNKPIRSDNLALNLGIGGLVGFLSGLVSIGGGIFLSPILHLLNWDEAKKISALASFFILVNSISGMIGQLSQSAVIDWQFALPLLLAVFIGGQIGSRLGSTFFNPILIKRVTAVLIFIVAVNILRNNL